MQKKKKNICFILFYFWFQSASHGMALGANWQPVALGACA